MAEIIYRCGQDKLKTLTASGKSEILIPPVGTVVILEDKSYYKVIGHTWDFTHTIRPFGQEYSVLGAIIEMEKL